MPLGAEEKQLKPVLDTLRGAAYATRAALSNRPLWPLGSRTSVHRRTAAHHIRWALHMPRVLRDGTARNARLCWRVIRLASPRQVALTSRSVVKSGNLLAEREGFEPPVPCGTTAFETAAFDHSATSPIIFAAPSVLGRCGFSTTPTRRAVSLEVCGSFPLRKCRNGANSK